MSNFKIRRMVREDLDAIYQIENSSFTVPWSKESLRNELTINQFAYYLVVELDGEVIGYGGMWIIADEAHVTNIAIAPSYRGQKWGEKLVMAMKQHAAKQGAVGMTLEVRPSNIVALRLYAKMGFYQTGIRPKYYSDDGEDALVMWVNFKDEADQQMETKSSKYV